MWSPIFPLTRQSRGAVLPWLVLVSCLGLVSALLRGMLPALGQEEKLSREVSIERIEKLGGSVGIDSEQPNQPVWKVDLSEVAVDPEVIGLLQSFPMLEVLHFDRTPLTDALLKRIGEIRTLRELSLEDTKITDAGLVHLTGLSALEKLNLNGTKTTNAGLQTLAPLKQLHEILYADTEITELGLDLLVDAQQRYQPPVSRTEDALDGSSSAMPTSKTESKDSRAIQLAASLHALGRALYPSAVGNPERHREAVALLEQALLGDPTNELIQLDLADAYVNLSTDETLTLALGLYEAVLAEHPGDDALLGRIADAYGRLGNFDAAIAVAAARLRRDVKSPFPAALQIADFSAQSGELARGISELKTVAQTYPQDPGVKLLLATLLIEAGHSEECKSQIDATLRILPSDSPLRKVAQRLKEGK